MVVMVIMMVMVLLYGKIVTIENKYQCTVSDLKCMLHTVRAVKTNQVYYLIHLLLLTLIAILSEINI